VASLGNVIWFIFGGEIMALLWLIIGGVFYITVIGIPFGRACFEFAKLSAFPFGKEIIKDTELKGASHISSARKVISTILNILWLIIGVPMTILYFILGIMSFITIIGIPVGVIYIRMGKFIIKPFGARVVSKRQAYASSAANEIEKRMKKPS
jgi:uncharacterized membrane protein YccF (DUF307 family)